MVHMSDTVIPLTLKECQANGCNIITMVTEIVDCAMCSVHQLSTTMSVVKFIKPLRLYQH